MLPSAAGKAQHKRARDESFVPDDCLEEVQRQSAQGSHNRRERAYRTGYDKGLAEGKKLADAVLKSTNEALQSRLASTLEQLAEESEKRAQAAASRADACHTSSTFIIENTQLRNQVAAQESRIQLLEEELTALRKYKATALKLQSGSLSPSSSSSRPSSSPYLKKPPQP